MTTRDELVRRAWEILRGHVGAKNPLSSSALSRVLGIGDHDRGTTVTRSLITELLRRGFPIGATERGYFVLESEAEKDRYVGDLADRADRIAHRASLVNRAWMIAQSEKDEERRLIRWVPEPDEEG
jgi:3-dehydroquinate synthase class II